MVPAILSLRKADKETYLKPALRKSLGCLKMGVVLVFLNLISIDPC